VKAQELILLCVPFIPQNRCESEQTPAMGKADCPHLLPPITEKIKNKYAQIHNSNMFINMKNIKFLESSSARAKHGKAGVKCTVSCRRQLQFHFCGRVINDRNSQFSPNSLGRCIL